MDRGLLVDDDTKRSGRLERERIPGRPLDLNKATSLVKSAALSGNFEEGWGAYVAAAEPDAILKCAALHLCARATWFERAREVFESMSPSRVACGSMLDVCARCRRVEFAKELFHAMDAQRVEKDIIAYNSMVQVCGMCRQPREALAYFEGISPALWDQASPANQQIAFQLVMTAFARVGDYGKTRDLFGQMVARQIPPNNAHFNALLTACADGPHAQLAQQVFDLMPQYRVEPNVVNWTILLTCHRHDLPRCLALVQELEAAGGKATGLTYQELLKAHVLARDGPGARGLIRAKGGQWNSGRKLESLVRQAEELP